MTQSTATFRPSLTSANGFLESQPHKTTDIEELKQSDWFATVIKNMQEGEYHENGFSAQPRSARIPIGDYDATTSLDQITYKTLPGWKIAFNLDKRQIGKGIWQINGNQSRVPNRE